MQCNRNNSQRMYILEEGIPLLYTDSYRILICIKSWSLSVSVKGVVCNAQDWQTPSSSTTIVCSTRGRSDLQTQDTAHLTSHAQYTSRTGRLCCHTSQSFATLESKATSSLRTHYFSISRSHSSYNINDTQWKINNVCIFKKVNPSPQRLFMRIFVF